MGFRFQKRIKILPGVRINLSKSGVSTSIGRPGATVNVRKGKVKATVGVPGTGVSYSMENRSSGDKPTSSTPTSSFLSGLLAGLGPLGVIGVLVVIGIFIALIFR